VLRLNIGDLGLGIGDLGLNVRDLGLNIRGLNIRGLNIGNLGLVLDGELDLGLSNVRLGGHELFLHGDVVIDFFHSLGGDIFHSGFISGLGDVFSLVFNGVVVSVSPLDGNIFNSFNGFVVSVGPFIRDLFKSGFPSDGLSHGGGLSNNLRLDI